MVLRHTDGYELTPRCRHPSYRERVVTWRFSNRRTITCNQSACSRALPIWEFVSIDAREVRSKTVTLPPTHLAQCTTLATSTAPDRDIQPPPETPRQHPLSHRRFVDTFDLAVVASVRLT